MNRNPPPTPHIVRRASVALALAVALGLGAAAPAAAALPVACGDGPFLAVGCAQRPPHVDPAPPLIPPGCHPLDGRTLDPCDSLG